MLHIAPVYSRQSEMSLPTHHPAVNSQLDAPATKGARSWFEAPPGTLKHGVKSHLVGMLAEFIGTTLFLLFALGGAQVASTAQTSVAGGSQRADAVDSVAAVANTSNLLYIAFSFGISLSVCVFVFAPISGALLNPALSLGLVLSGAMKPLRAALLTVAQVAGGIAASALVYGLLPGGFDVRTTLSKDTSIVQGLFIEVVLTAMLMLTVLPLAIEKNEAAPVAALGIGLALFCAELVGVNYTGGSLNPARSIGPGVISGNFSGYFWIYVVGPLLGAALAAGLYRLFKLLDYQTCLRAHSPPATPSASEKPLPASPPFLHAGAAFPLLNFPPPVRRLDGEGELTEEPLKPVPEPRDPRIALRSTPSASTLSPGQLDRIEVMLHQLLRGRPVKTDEEAAVDKV
ncbi:hypothetical protein JCM8097_000991 [Rhodosporidiobolus ruineniae]